MSLPAKPILELVNLGKSYGKTKVVGDINLSIEENEFFSIIGPSGSGKSTIFKMIIGVLPPTTGLVLVRGEDVGGLPPDQRGVVMLWQSLALFPHMSVRDNVGFGLAVRGIGSAERLRRVKHFLEMVDLGGFESRHVHGLSGGEKQRVALARALIVEPDIVLLDEPLGGLDTHVRRRLLAKFREIHRTTGKTFVMVTHDQSEALSTSSRIAILSRGRLEQVGTPVDVLTKPRSPFVAQFVGNKNVLTGSVTHVLGNRTNVSTACGEFSARIPDWSDVSIAKGTSVSYVIDAHKVAIGGNGDNRLNGRLDVRSVIGGTEVLEVMVSGLGLLRCERPLLASTRCEISDSVKLSWNTDDAYVLAAEVR